MRHATFALLLLLVLTGCGEIAVDPKPVPPEPASTADYDLAVVSVDFDPALQGNRLPISDTYAVLVAVENRGTLTVYNARVNAFLKRSTDERVMLQGSQIVGELAPGAIKVVRIQPAGTLPATAATYDLTVRAEPLPKETILSNNIRGFTIRVAP